MKLSVVVLVAIVCVALICQSSAFLTSKQRSDVRKPVAAAGGGKRWLPGIVKNQRYIFPSIKHRTTQQKRKRTVSAWKYDVKNNRTGANGRKNINTTGYTVFVIYAKNWRTYTFQLLSMAGA